MAANERQEYGTHYQADYQHWDMIEEHGVGYLEGCATKYLTRWRKKNGRQDLRKALHYVEKLAELHEHVNRQPRGSAPVEALTRFKQSNDLGVKEAVAVGILTGQWTAASLKLVREIIEQLLLEDEAREQGHPT